MCQIKVNGGRPLQGALTVQGSKNAALPILAASILHEGVSVLHNCPRISDVNTMIQILESMGCSVRWERDALIIDASGVSRCQIERECAAKMRSSVLLLGALLGRFGECKISYPGGCVIGKRPIDLHLRGLSALGVAFREESGDVYGKGRPRGGYFCLPFCSVGATENLLLAAVCAKGVTVLQGCAREPEIQALCSFLSAMGADIRRVSADGIAVFGQAPLHDTEYTIPTDRIVAGTYALAAAGTRGNVKLYGISRTDLAGQLDLLEQMGVQLSFKKDCMEVDARRGICALPLVRTCPYPGFPTDLQSQMMAVLCTALGVSRIQETVFENRFGTVQELIRMGADIQVQGDCAWITGTEMLQAARVCARDLRGGAALLIAGLEAVGETVVDGLSYIERGYEDVCRDFRLLGADVSKGKDNGG